MTHIGPKMPRTSWLYIGILLLCVIVFWSRFWPVEFKLPEVQGDKESLGNILKEFTNSIKEGGTLINQLKDNLKEQVSGGEIPSELINQLSQKVQEELWQERTNSWLEWSNEKISFKLPPGWFVGERNGKFVISSYDEKLSIKPANRGQIEISLTDGKTPEEALTITPTIIGEQGQFQQIIEDFKKTIKISL
jgi:hypothetical protein